MSDRGIPESTILYRVFRKVYRAKRAAVRESGASEAYSPGRDPLSASNILAATTDQLGWGGQLAQARVAQEWADIVGPNIAEHSWPMFEGTVLLVRCTSTAWASSLGLMRNTVEANLRQRYPEISVTEIRFRGPDAPTWKKGPRSIPGRGPRDTYG